MYKQSFENKSPKLNSEVEFTEYKYKKRSKNLPKNIDFLLNKY